MRLGDLDALKEEFLKNEDRKGYLTCDWETIIDNAPTVGERPHGEWKLISMGLTYKYQCSVCGRTISTTPMFLSDYPYCHCGAEMRGDKE